MAKATVIGVKETDDYFGPAPIEVRFRKETKGELLILADKVSGITLRVNYKDIEELVKAEREN